MSTTPEFDLPPVEADLTLLNAPDHPAPERRDQVTILAPAGILADVAVDLRMAILLALADEPRAVVCDLTGVLDGSDADAQALIATTGPQVRDWPAVPVAMSCSNAELGRRLQTSPMSEYVIFLPTMSQSVAAVERTAPPTTLRLQLSPVLTASRTARDFVSRACLDWDVASGIPSASLVVSEIVTNGLRHAVTDLDLSVSRHGGILRLALRDRSSEPLRERSAEPDSDHGRGLAIVHACSRSWGVLPTTDGGKVVWAVLDV